MEWLGLTIMCAVLLGISSIFEKRILKKEQVNEFLATYSLIFLVMMLPFAKYVNFDIPGKLLGIIIIKGFILTIAGILSTKALKKLEISTAMPLANLTPLFLLVLGTFFLGEILNASKIAGIVILVSGTYILQMKNIGSFLHPFKKFSGRYALYMVIATFIVAISAMIDKVLLAKIDFFTYLFLSMFMLFMFYTAIQFYKYRGFDDILHALKVGGLWVFLICALNLIADIFYFLAVSMPGAYISLIIPIKRLSTLFSTIVSGEIYHDHMLKNKIIACVLMVIGATLIIL